MPGGQFNSSIPLSNDQEVRKLRMEFNAIDIDGDGRVDKQEMYIFLAKKGIDEDHRQEIVDELFNKCDQDLSGKIEINEFVT
jgi:Ca2+-binding EF-hand superfamily protein